MNKFSEYWESKKDMYAKLNIDEATARTIWDDAKRKDDIKPNNISRKDMFVNDVLELIEKEPLNIKCDSFCFLLSLYFTNYRLRVIRESVGGSYWKKSKTIYTFKLYSTVLDKTKKITNDDFKKICESLKNVDTDTVEYFLDRTTMVMDSI